MQKNNASFLEKKENFINLTLVRHSQTDWNKAGIMQGQKNVELNSVGREDARRLSEEIKNKSFDIIFSSPLKRCKETADIVNTFDLEIEYDDRLKERSYGKFEGYKTKDILKKYPDIKTFEKNGLPYWIEVPTAETYDEVRERVENFLNELKKKHRGMNVLIVSHGDTLDMFYAVLNNVTNEDAYGKFSKNTHAVDYEIMSE